MAATPFRAVNWSPNELVGEDKMTQISANMNWLRDNTPRVVYTLPSGLRRVEGVRIASGRIMIAARKSDDATATVRFSNFFSSRCQPNITTGIVATGQVRIFCVTHGIGQLQPDDRGFQVVVNIAAENKKTDKIAKSFYVHWQAMGY